MTSSNRMCWQRTTGSTTSTASGSRNPTTTGLAAHLADRFCPTFLGGKTYIYMNYEGERYPRSGPYEKTVPSDTLREGIIQERDAERQYR